MLLLLTPSSTGLMCSSDADELLWLASPMNDGGRWNPTDERDVVGVNMGELEPGCCWSQRGGVDVPECEDTAEVMCDRFGALAAPCMESLRE